MSRTGFESSSLVFSKSSWNLRFRTSFLDFSASIDAANFFSRSASAPFSAPSASSTDENLRGVLGASWSITARSNGSIFSRALQQGQKSSKSPPRVSFVTPTVYVKTASTAPFPLDALPAVVAARAPGVRARRDHPLDPARLDDLRSGRRRHVLVQPAGLRTRDRSLRQSAHEELSPAAVGARDREAVARADLAVRLAARAVDLDLSALARGLRPRPGREHARDVEPDVQADALQRRVRRRVARAHGREPRGRDASQSRSAGEEAGGSTAGFARNEPCAAPTPSVAQTSRSSALSMPSATSTKENSRLRSTRNFRMARRRGSC